MRCYLIQDHHITVSTTVPADLGDAVLLSKTIEIDPKRFPIARLLALHNALPGVVSIQRFPDRKTAIQTFWSALGALPLGPVRAESKQDKIIALLRRPEGCDLEGLMAVSGWQRHSVRGVLSGVLKKRLGLAVESFVSGDQRIYRIAA